MKKNKDRNDIKDVIDSEFVGLSISKDSIEDDEVVACMLYTPNMEDKLEHFHIDLKYKEAETLRDWLNTFLIETKYGK